MCKKGIVKKNEVDLELEKGKNLMLRRVLVKEPVKEEAKKRRALFKTTCKILGKVCKVIIDSGSTNNVILEEVVQKLELIKIPHVCPYRVTWINKGQNILVNEKLWVDITIGKSQDKILCDVFPMDA